MWSKRSCRQHVVNTVVAGASIDSLFPLGDDSHLVFGIDCVGTKLMLATSSHLDVDVAEKVIKGIVDGCKQSDCSLLGGDRDQTAGKEGEYDLSGCAVGIVSKDSVINGKKYIIAADFLIGLSSSGLHTNGFSLVRRLVTGPFDLQNSNYSTEQYITEKDSTGHDLARERHVEILHNIED